MSCARVFCERSSNRVNFWPASKIKGSIANKKPAECYLLPLSSLSLSSSQFCLAGSRQNVSVMLYLPCLCVCVFIICGFSLFSHSFFFAGALKFKQSAINYTCWALSRFPAYGFPITFVRATQKHLHTSGRQRVSIRFAAHYRSGSIRFNCVTQAVTPSVSHFVTLSLCQCASPACLAVCQSVRNPNTASPPSRALPHSALPIISRAIFIN